MAGNRSIYAYLLDVLSRRRRFAVACFVLVVCGTALATFTATPIYRAKAIVQIEQPSGFVLRTDIFGAGFTRTVPQEQAELTDTYPFKLLVESIATIADRDRINLAQYTQSEQIRSLFENILCDSTEKTDIDACIAYHAARLEGRLRPEPKEEDDFQQDLRARLIEDTGLIELFAEARSPVRAQNAANAAALTVVWQNERLRKEEARYTVRFIREQLDAPNGVKARLARADERLAQFKKQKAFLDAGEETRSLLQQMVEVSNRRWQGILRLNDLRTRLSATRQQLGREPSTLVSPTIYENPTVQEIKKQLVTAEAELLSLQAQFTDEHPRVQSAQARVNALRDRLRQEALRIESVQRLPNPVHQELYKNAVLLSADIVGQEAQMTALEDTLNNLRQRMLAVPELERQLTQLLREQQALEQQYLFLMQRLQEAELTQAVKLGNARVVELAQLPGKRVKPRRILNMLMGILLGLMLAVGFSLLLEQVDRRLPSAQFAAEWLNLPLLTAIPVVTDSKSVRNDADAGEAFRRLRTAIRLSTLDNPVRTVLITSALPAEGKTFLAYHLAASVAQTGCKVVLVDANLHAPALHRYDGLHPSPGLAEWLLGQAQLHDVIRPTALDKLWVLPAGNASSTAYDLLDSSRIPDLLTQLSQEWELIVLDTPASDRFVDAQMLAPHCDAVLLVVQPGVTPRDIALSTVETFRSVPNCRLLGIVANRVADSSARRVRRQPVRRRSGQ